MNDDNARRVNGDPGWICVDCRGHVYRSASGNFFHANVSPQLRTVARAVMNVEYHESAIDTDS